MKPATIILSVALVLGMGLWAGSQGLYDPDPFVALPGPDAQPGINPMVGKWVNMDPQASHFTKMAIDIFWGEMGVYLWASCLPEDCYWGHVRAHAPKGETQRIETTWIRPIANDFQDIIYLPLEDQIIMRGTAVYTNDASGRIESYTYRFARGDFPTFEE
jgi:hypothetical protein